MILSHFAPILLNGSLMAPPITEGFCHIFYGHWPHSRDCVRAIDKLVDGPRSVPYTVDQDPGQHNLPLHVQSGPFYR